MYRNAEKVLPAELLRQVQEYVQGEELYIPKSSSARLGWGEHNGTRKQLQERNQIMLQLRTKGCSIDGLCQRFHLGRDTVRRILRQERKKAGIAGKHSSQTN